MATPTRPFGDAGRPAMAPQPKPATRPARTGEPRGVAPIGPTGDKGGGPGGKPTTNPGPLGGGTPFRDWLQQAMGHLPPEMLQALQARVGPLVSQIEAHIGQASSGMLPYHPSLDHMHAPDGSMIPPMGQGGLAQAMLGRLNGGAGVPTSPGATWTGSNPQQNPQNGSGR